jgi:predicted MFS family arabinose efflux permease
MKLTIKRNEWICIYGFFVIGLMVGKMGPLMLPAGKDLDLSASQIGFILSAFFLSSLVGIATGAIRGNKTSNTTYAWMGCALVMLGYGLGFFSGGYLSLLLSTSVFGTGFGFFQVGMNAGSVDVVASLPLKQQAGRLAFFQFFFGLGAAAAPLVVELCAGVLRGWNWSFIVLGLVGPGILAMLLMGGKLEPEIESQSHDDPVILPPAFKVNLLFVWLMVAGFFYAGLEGSTFNWIPYYWEKQFPGNTILSSSGIMAGFWILFSLSRLLMGRVIEKVGSITSVVGGGFCAVVLLMTWILLAGSIWIEIPLILLLAGVYGYLIPTQIAVINQCFPGNSASVTSFLFLAITISISLFSAIIGKFGAFWGASVIPYTLLIAAIGFLIPYMAAGLRLRKA